MAGCTLQEPPSKTPVAGPAPSAASASSTEAASPVANTAASPAPSARDAKPQTAEECKRVCNGEWSAHGLTGVVSCLCRTTDAGKDCRGKNECQGECLLEPLRTEVVDKGPPARGYFIGKCAEFVTSFGCSRRIQADTQSRGPVDLSEPPPKLCMD